MQNKLTEKHYWENYWKGIDLPMEIKRESSAPNIVAELDVFDQYFPKEKKSVLEIGGAPGQYLAYFHKEFGYSINCLDYSTIGCEKARENFKLLNIPGRVYNGDIFSEDLQMDAYDVVCSFGFIEHFSDITAIVGRHVALLKPGGMLVLGVPNFLGINHWFLKRLAPGLLAMHNLKSMDASSWSNFEETFHLELIFKQYVGGFEPGVFLQREQKSLLNNSLFFIARLLNRVFRNNFRWLRKYNSKNTSGYLLGIYRKPLE